MSIVDNSKIKILLWAYNITESEFCKDCGIDLELLYKIYERDCDEIKLVDINKIASCFHVSAKFLLTD